MELVARLDPSRPKNERKGEIGMIAVRKISHASYETPDLDKQIEYYTDILGLTLVAREKDAVYLANTIEHHSVILRKGSEPKCTRLGFQVAPDDDLDAFEKQTAAHGLRTSRKRDSEPTIDDMVVFEDPKGTVIEVFKRPEPQKQAFRPSGIIPHKLGHVAFHVTDVAATTRFYCDVLGFRVSDWMGDYFSFLRCGVDHHTINLVETGSNKHFHTAFELRDWAHMQTSCDFLSNNGYRILWGPGRHGIGHNLFAYHRGPNGLITELFAELDQMKDETLGYFDPRPWHRDNPQRPKTWPKNPSAANLWGPMPPEEMMQ
jgi:catechol 2,3-dioxygenase-like lactoylglutathione lyase family enzyme